HRKGKRSTNSSMILPQPKPTMSSSTSNDSVISQSEHQANSELGQVSPPTSVSAFSIPAHSPMMNSEPIKSSTPSAYTTSPYSLGTSFFNPELNPYPQQLSPIATAQAEYLQMLQAYRIWASSFGASNQEHPLQSQNSSQSSSSGELVCSYCAKHFSTTHQLEDHMFEHLSIRTVNYRCLECNSESFKSRANLSAHALTHHSRSMFQCVPCEKL